MANYKTKRIATEISRYVSNIILLEVSDEILKSITITGCVVAKDLSNATLYFTSILDMDVKELEKEVNEAAPFIRGKLAELIELRHIPSLKFVFDKSIEYGEKIEKIIKEIHEK